MLEIAELLIKLENLFPYTLLFTNPLKKLSNGEECVKKFFLKYLIQVTGIYEVCSKSIANFVFFSKIIFLFMNIYFVRFKVIPTRYYTLVATFFSNSRSTSKNHFFLSCSVPLSMPSLCPQS